MAYSQDKNLADIIPKEAQRLSILRQRLSINSPQYVQGFKKTMDKQ